MSFPLLRRYLLKAAVDTTDPALQGDMVRLLQQLSPDQANSSIQRHEDDEVMAPELNQGLPSQTNKIKGLEDIMLQKAMPELVLPNPETPETFGKLDGAPIKVSMWTLLKRASTTKIKMAAYIKDVRVSDLPEKVKEDAKRFLPEKVKNPTVVHYGMMVRELVDRADPQNYEAATKAVKKELDGMTGAEREKARDAFFKKAKDKYVLIVNEQIVDGHHFLAKAKYFDVSNSLNVLDLTPARFQ
jgi:hypothetical protein